MLMETYNLDPYLSKFAQDKSSEEDSKLFMDNNFTAYDRIPVGLVVRAAHIGTEDLGSTPG